MARCRHAGTTERSPQTYSHTSLCTHTHTLNYVHTLTHLTTYTHTHTHTRLLLNTTNRQAYNMSLIQLQNHLLIKKILLSTIFFWSKIKLQDTYHEQFEKSSFLSFITQIWHLKTIKKMAKFLLFILKYFFSKLLHYLCYKSFVKIKSAAKMKC